MAVKLIRRATKYSSTELCGLAADTKPTGVFEDEVLDVGAEFYELDTGNGYIYDGAQWWPEVV